MKRTTLLLITVLAVVGCRSVDTTDTSTTGPPTTTIDVTTTTQTAIATTTTVETTTTTTHPRTTDAKESTTFPGDGEMAFLTTVDVSDDASITFTFEGDVVPAYRVEYVEPPIRADASGMAVDLGGDAFLQVVVSPGAGVDLSGDEARETFTGEDRFIVDSVEGVTELAETGDFEATLTWTIGLTGRHTFSVEASPGSLVLELGASNEATAALLGSNPSTCSSPDGFSVSYPSDWWASAETVACGHFAPDELDIEPNTDVRAPLMMFVDAVDFGTAVAPTESRDELSRAVSTLDGRSAVRIVSDVEEGLYPTGTEVTSYFVELADEDGDERTLVATTAGLEIYDYDRNVALLDEMFRTIELEQPGPSDLVAAYQGGGEPFEVTAETSGSQTCMTVTPGGEQACLEKVSGNQVVAAIAGDALVGLAGPDVLEVVVETSVSFLPFETASGTFVWAVPFDGSDFTVLGSDGDTILIGAAS